MMGVRLYAVILERIPMANARFEQLLAGTAVALALALTPYASSAFAATDETVTAAVPMPESADLPPPSIKDVAPTRPEAPAAVTKPTPAASEAAKPAPASNETTATVPANEGAKLATSPTADSALVDTLRTQL